MGKLLIIAGFPCSGKTTYIDAIQEFFGDLISRRNFYTDRPLRSEEERLNSMDYTFITGSEYEKLFSEPDWHWTEWYNFHYGFLIPSEIARMRKGETITIGPAPHIQYLRDMQKIHGKNNVRSILLYVARETIFGRLKKRPPHEHKRILAFNQSEIDEYAKIADVVFTPKNNILKDCEEILKIAERMI